ncbi:MAG: hypothetical protein GX943_00770 [Candidatus Pacebacteria bacterium]|jgi:hypothetical protein|nr:hypothetical protein [Candidatus Paceibacterota bacterium]
MAKKRRKIDKIRAKKRLIKTAKKPLASEKTHQKLEKKEIIKTEQITSLFNYDPKLINQDLKKTLLVTLVVLVVLALIVLRYT